MDDDDVEPILLEIMQEFKESTAPKAEKLAMFRGRTKELTVEQKTKLFKLLQPAGKFEETEPGVTCMVLENLKERYTERLLTTGISGFLYDQLDKHTRDDISSDKLEVEKTVIKDFLDTVLTYKPAIHVQTAKESTDGDPERIELEEMDPPIIGKVPSADLFTKIQRFRKRSYETEEKAVRKIYNDVGLLHWYAQLLKPFEGDETAEAMSFAERNTQMSELPVYAYQKNRRLLVGKFSDSPERIEFYNRNPAICKRLVDNLRLDESMLKDVMGHRVKRVKKQKIRRGEEELPGGIVDVANMPKPLFTPEEERAIRDEAKREAEEGLDDPRDILDIMVATKLMNMELTTKAVGDEDESEKPPALKEGEVPEIPEHRKDVEADHTERKPLIPPMFMRKVINYDDDGNPIEDEETKPAPGDEEGKPAPEPPEFPDVKGDVGGVMIPILVTDGKEMKFKEVPTTLAHMVAGE